MKTKPSRRVSDYEIVDHGIEHNQYFQGCGIAFSDFEHCVTGCGDNFAEAIDDCLEQIACGGQNIDVEAFEQQMKHDENVVDWPTEPSVMDMEGVDLDDCDMYYYVSIRYNLA